MANGEQSDGGWMADVQRMLAIVLIGTFAILLIAMIAKLVWSGSVEQTIDILKIVVPAAITFAGTVLGYFYGSSKSKEQTDASQQQIIDKLTPPPAPAPPAPPVAPVPTWWSKLTEDEKNDISNAASNDPRVSAFITASQVGAATPDDLAYLVSKDLLTSARAAEIAA